MLRFAAAVLVAAAASTQAQSPPPKASAADARLASRTASAKSQEGDLAAVLRFVRPSSRLHIDRTFRFDPPLKTTLQGPALLEYLKRQVEDRSTQYRYGVKELSHSCDYYERDDGKAVETCRRYPAGALEPVYTYTVFARDEHGLFWDTMWLSSSPLF